MAVPFSVLGWAFRWHDHTSGGETIQNMSRPRYSDDFQKPREIIYDEWAEYTFHFRVRRTTPNVRLFIEGMMVAEKDAKPVYMSKISPVDRVDPREPYWELDPDPGHSVALDDHTVILFWPSRYKNCHRIGTTHKFQVRFGWKKRNEADSIVPKFTPPLPLISIFVSDVIPKN